MLGNTDSRENLHDVVKSLILHVLPLSTETLALPVNFNDSLDMYLKR